MTFLLVHVIRADPILAISSIFSTVCPMELIDLAKKRLISAGSAKRTIGRQKWKRGCMKKSEANRAVKSKGGWRVGGAAVFCRSPSKREADKSAALRPGLSKLSRRDISKTTTRPLGLSSSFATLCILRRVALRNPSTREFHDARTPLFLSFSPSRFLYYSYRKFLYVCGKFQHAKTHGVSAKIRCKVFLKLCYALSWKTKSNGNWK